MVLKKRKDGFLVQTSNKLREFEFERMFSTALFLLKKERLGLGIWVGSVLTILPSLWMACLCRCAVVGVSF